MTYFISVTGRLCAAVFLAAVLLAAMLLASTPESCFADDPETTKAALEAPPEKQVAKPEDAKAEKEADAEDEAEVPSGYEDASEDEAEAPSGYEDAPEASDEPEEPAVDLSKLSEFNKAMLILDRPVDANVVNLEKRYFSQVQQVVKVERSFMLRACKLDKKQQIRIAKVSDRCAKVVARQCAISQNIRRRGGRFGGPIMLGDLVDANVKTKEVKPKKEVRRLLLLSVDELLSPEQKKRYAEENQKRDDYLKRTTVLNIVALIDKRLILTDQQREQLTESLTKNWDQSWTNALQHMMSSHQYLPQMQDEHVVKFLDDKQKALWRGIQKTNFGSSGDFGMGHSGQLVDDGFDELAKEDVEKDAAVKVVPTFELMKAVDSGDEKTKQNKPEN